MRVNRNCHRKKMTKPKEFRLHKNQMRLTQCKVKNKDVAGPPFSPIMRHYFSDGRVIPLFLLLLSSLPTIHLTIKDKAIWNFFGLSFGFFQKLVSQDARSFQERPGNC